MRIDKVSAIAFGPLRGRTLELSPGMTVVVGRNESGKSSWHAATYAALCGRRRGAGGSRTQAKVFRLKHRPWTGDTWAVSAVVTLSDGRRIELTHDLEGKVACRATDLTLGRDVSAEVMHQGTPDGSKWLGLDRDSFRVTACVDQAELLSVLSHAEGLQNQLQKAAANAGAADPTAAQALQAIEDFVRDNVGQDRVNARKPLRRAIDSVARAREERDNAQAEHATYLGMVEVAAAKRAAANRAETALAGGETRVDQVGALLTETKEAGRLQQEADRISADALDQAAAVVRARQQAHRAHELHDWLGGQQPRGIVDDEELATCVASAVDRWTSLPDPVILTGPSAAELQARLDGLPAAPDGDVEPHRTVERATNDLDAATGLAAQREAERPTDPEDTTDEVEAAIRAGSGPLRDLASRIDTAPDLALAEAAAATSTQALAGATAARAAAETAAAAAQHELEQAEETRRAAREDLNALSGTAQPGFAPPRHSPNIPLLVLAVALGAAGAALIATNTPLGLGLIGGAALLAFAALRAPGSTGSTRAPAPEDPDRLGRARAAAAEAESGVQTARAQHEGAAARLLAADRALAQAEAHEQAASNGLRATRSIWSDLITRCAVLGLAPDADHLRGLASKAESVAASRAAWQRAERLAEQDRAAIDDATAELRRALAARGAADLSGSEPVAALLASYRIDCRLRAEQARISAARGDLEQALAARRAAERGADEASSAGTRARQALAQAAHQIGAREHAGEVTEAEAPALVAELTAWQAQRRQAADGVEKAHQDWAELQALLDGGTLADLDARVESAEAELTRLQEAQRAAREAVALSTHRVLDLAAKLDVALPQATGPDAVRAAAEALRAAEATRDQMRSDAAERSAEADHAQGAHEDRAKGLRSVPEAEESLAAADAELARVQELAATLDHTRRFLKAAQDTVHRDIAPVLANSLEARLPRVTDERYTEALVDPATLAVKVRLTDGRWIEATQLSVGTAEQVYLLLRIALAEHLGNPDEPCPLLLDDVTVQADDIRTTEILETLLTLSEDRQIILFAQEEEILEWARERLVDQERHGIVELEQIPVG